MKSNQKIFFNLGFLVLFSTILNGILKNIFQISRPVEDLWLVVPTDNLGFPSGDVQVATVFWGLVLLNVRSVYLKILIGMLLLGIACSRVYLGVHSLDDVCAGLVVGIITLGVWRHPSIDALTSGWEKGYTRSLFFLTILTSTTYMLITKESPWPAVIVMSMGASIGFAISLAISPQVSLAEGIDIQFKKITVIFASVIILILGAKLIPVIKSSTLVFYITGLIKYGILLIGIFVWLPKIQNTLLTVKSRNK